MVHFIRENARTMRALVAVCAACALSILFVSQEIGTLREKERLVFRTNGLIWRMSETIFEVQRLSSDLVGYSEGRRDKEEVEMRFDILWGRLDLVAGSEIGKTEGLAPVIAELQAFLRREEEMIYEADTISDEEVLRLHSILDDHSKTARQAWAATFAVEDLQRQFVDLQSGNAAGRAADIAGYALIALLLAYVVSEVFLANRAQKRIQKLHHMAHSANEAKSLFLANVSHEIRTPLNGILGMASELSESDLDTDQRECITVIEQSGELLLGTINDVLDLSKVEAGRLELERAPFDLHRVLKTARDLHASRAREKGLKLRLEISDFVPHRVVGDERRLQQVLHNLVANAVKFTDKGCVTIDALIDAKSGEVLMRVSDTGPGIAPSALDKIFDPFVQADASVTRKYGGTGLGLAISSQITEAMGGQLTVKSDVGDGARFEVRLPLQRVEAKDLKLEKLDMPETSALCGRRILIVDDNATNRLILERFLAPVDCIIYAASGGDEAVALAKETDFDAILMDIQMPGVDGVEATRRIREAERASGNGPVPIFAVTANVLTHQVTEYVAAGIDRVLPKPLPKQRLLRELVAVAKVSDQI